jgi:Myb-like DNA-binding domain
MPKRESKPKRQSFQTPFNNPIAIASASSSSSAMAVSAAPMYGNPAHTINAAANIKPTPVPPPGNQPEQKASKSKVATSAWSSEEDKLLLSLRAAGKNWIPIQREAFPHKSSNACRKHHERLIAAKGNEDWDAEKMQKLGQEYMRIRKEMWGKLGEIMDEKWQTVEQKVRLVSETL